MISYTDGEDHAARTSATRTLITDFARLFYLERDVRRAFETFVAPGYIQHNPGIPDGRDAAIAGERDTLAWRRQGGRTIGVRRDADRFGGGGDRVEIETVLGHRCETVDQSG